MQLLCSNRLAAASLALSLAFPTLATGLEETFSVDPATTGWVATGDTNLFHWDAANGVLNITWNSSRPNSYFARSLETILTPADDFSVSFDLLLNEFTAGYNPAKPNPFQLAIGFLNLGSATSTNFFRGTGSDSPNLVEFSFFPDPGGAWQWGSSLTAVMIDHSGTNWASGGFAPLALTNSETYRIRMAYTAADQILRTTIWKSGVLFTEMESSIAGASFLGFAVDHFAICSYSDAGQDPSYSGSIMASGQVDNVSISLPDPSPGLVAAGRLENGIWRVIFRSSAQWVYTLERSDNLSTWTELPDSEAGTGGQVELTDLNPPAGKAWYRLKAVRQ